MLTNRSILLSESYRGQILEVGADELRIIASGFRHPTELSADPHGAIYVADLAGTVYKLLP